MLLPPPAGYFETSRDDKKQSYLNTTNTDNAKATLWLTILMLEVFENNTASLTKDEIQKALSKLRTIAREIETTKPTSDWTVEVYKVIRSLVRF